MNLSRFLCFLPLICALSTHAAEVAVKDASATNKTDSASATDTNTAPTQLPANFTNSVDMQLVKISDSLWAGRFEVTQAQFQKITGGNPSAFVGDANPVDSVSYGDALDFCHRMTDADNLKKLIPEGAYYDLPTEDEWVTLAGDATLESAVTSLNGATKSSTSPVGSLAPNSLGLYDTRGNVLEFVKSGDETTPFRILKGGCWKDMVEINLRPAFRNYCKPDERQNTFGFRCVLRTK
jgi:formylglycine-generating enzyme required for sulfatase activity